MSDVRGQDPFLVLCCGRRRGLVKGALICSRCDFEHSKGTVIPNEHLATDVPMHITYVRISREVPRREDRA